MGVTGMRRGDERGRDETRREERRVRNGLERKDGGNR
jgi:hypothetical protein